MSFFYFLLMTPRLELVIVLNMKNQFTCSKVPYIYKILKCSVHFQDYIISAKQNTRSPKLKCFGAHWWFKWNWISFVCSNMKAVFIQRSWIFMTQIPHHLTCYVLSLFLKRWLGRSWWGGRRIWAGSRWWDHNEAANGRSSVI